MEVNTSKSAVVIFNRNHLHPEVSDKWYFNNTEIPIKREFTYLGILFVDVHGRNGGIHEACDRQLDSATRVTHAVWKRCAELNMHNPNTLSYLYGTLVQPVLNYGCEIWAPNRLGTVNRQSGLVGKCETIHTKFLKRALGVKQSTSNCMILEDFHRDPTWTQWLRQCVNFWNKIVSRKNDDLVKKALIENVQLTLTDSRSCCWSHGFLNCLVRIGVIEHPSDVIVDGSGTILKTIYSLYKHGRCE